MHSLCLSHQTSPPASSHFFFSSSQNPYNSPLKIPHPALFIFYFFFNLCFSPLNLIFSHPFPVSFLSAPYLIFYQFSKPVPSQPPPWRGDGVFLAMRPMHMAPSKTGPHSKKLKRSPSSSGQHEGSTNILIFFYLIKKN